MDSDNKIKLQGEGLKFLYEMELVDDPQLINNLKLNILMLSNSIKEVEFLSIYENKQMLIWLDLSWFGKTFFNEHICTAVYDIVQQLLPNFAFRVTSNPEILKAAKARVKLAFKGANNETSNDSIKPNDESSSICKNKLSEESNSMPDSKE